MGKPTKVRRLGTVKPLAERTPSAAPPRATAAVVPVDDAAILYRVRQRMAWHTREVDAVVRDVLATPDDPADVPSLYTKG